jgi:hypothetical protein
VEAEGSRWMKLNVFHVSRDTGSGWCQEQLQSHKPPDQKGRESPSGQVEAGGGERPQAS